MGWNRPRRIEGSAPETGSGSSILRKNRRRSLSLSKSSRLTAQSILASYPENLLTMTCNERLCGDRWSVVAGKVSRGLRARLSSCRGFGRESVWVLCRRLLVVLRFGKRASTTTDRQRRSMPWGRLEDCAGVEARPESPPAAALWRGATVRAADLPCPQPHLERFSRRVQIA